jgi:hypothetical protein
MKQCEVNQKVNKVVGKYSYNLKKKEIQKKVNEIIKSINPFSFSEFENDIDFILFSAQKYMDKSWETTKGNIFEEIQIVISGGYKSDKVGVDIDFKDRNVCVGSKSSPNWANSDQRKRMTHNAGEINEKYNKRVVVCSSYGSGVKNFDGYDQYSGPNAWEFLSGDKEMMNKVMTAYDQSEIKKVKKQYYGDFINEVVLFWKEKFYIDDKFDYNLFLNYVSK